MDLNTGSRHERLSSVLAELRLAAPDVDGVALVSSDGLPMVAELPAGMDEERVAAMSAALLSLGERSADGLGRGNLAQLFVQGETGTVFLVSAGDEAVLVLVAAKGAKAGLVLFEQRRAAHLIAEILREPVSHAETVDEPNNDEVPTVTWERWEPVSTPAATPVRPAPPSVPAQAPKPEPAQLPVAKPAATGAGVTPPWQDPSLATWEPVRDAAPQPSWPQPSDGSTWA